MGDVIDDELEELTARAVEAEEGLAENGGGAKKRSRRKAKSVEASEESETNRSAGADGSEGQLGSAVTMAELDVDSLMPKDLPAPMENVKTLGDLYARYNIGESHDFKIHLYRTYPKIAPGGKKFDGFYDEYDIPLTLQQIQQSYGGGQYRIVIMGPHPKNPRMPKHYDSVAVSLAGDPDWERLPRALQGMEKKEADGMPAPMMMPAQENPTVVAAVMKVMAETVKDEREERRRVEDKADRRSVGDQGMIEPMLAAERRRSDDVIDAERRHAESERKMLEDRWREEREARMVMERSLEGRRQSSTADDLRALADTGLLKNGGDGEVARDMLSKVLEKHQSELAGVQEANGRLLEQLRAGHERELQSLREAARREMEAEREGGRAREGRIDERLNAEREERRRDGERYREAIAERDASWKARNESAVESLKQGYEQRIMSLTEAGELRVAHLQARIDELRNDLNDAKAKQTDQGDVLAQLGRYRDLKGMLGEMMDVPKPPETPVIPTTPEMPAWVQAVADSPVVERIAEKLLGGNGAAAPVQPQYQEGQLVSTPQGVMEVVRDPTSGNLALALRSQLDAYRAQESARQQRMGKRALPAQGGRRPAKSRSAGISAVPNLAEGLPKRVPPWEGGGEAASQRQPVAPPARRPAQRPAPRPATVPLPLPPVPEMSAQEQQVAGVIAQEVHRAVSEADEPEEFVERMMGAYPAVMIRLIVTKYTDAQIAQAIQQLAPQSAGATPAGRQFVLEAFRLLRAKVAE